MKNRIVSISLAVALVLSVGLIGCGGEEIPEYNLTISTTEGAEVTTPGEGTSTYDEGTVVNLVAEAEEGYRFVNWTGDVGTIANVNAARTTITMNDSYSITANFEEIPPIRYNLTISSTTGGSVTTPGEGTFTYDAGTVIDLLAEAEEGYQFARWTGNVDTVANINAASTTIAMNGNYSITANFVAEGAVYFADPNLEAAVRAAIGEPTGPIYPRDLEWLISLRAEERGISDLTGLEHATRLTELHLWDNQIRDISPLANFSKVTGLGLSGHQISDISLLANLTNLTELNLCRNQISDISPLANLINLNDLLLGANQISDIAPLANLTSLTKLRLKDNQISDISPLANLTSLTSLRLSWNQISDISPLANLSSLTSLVLSYNQISDISPLANLTYLTELWLWDNQISDISPLANLTSLTELRLTGNQISDISPLANLTNLTELYLSDNQISDISPLANLTSLTELSLKFNQISDISSLANLTSLTGLYLWGNQISDISPLVYNEGLSEGDKVYLTGNPLSTDSVNTYIPQLEARGVIIEYYN